MGIFKTLQIKKESGQYMTANEKRFIEASRKEMLSVLISQKQNRLDQLANEITDASEDLKNYKEELTTIIKREGDAE